MDQQVDHVVKRKATRLCKLSEKRKKMRAISVTESDTHRETASQGPVVELEADDSVRLSNQLCLLTDNGPREEPTLEDGDFTRLRLLSEASTLYRQKRANIEERGKKIKRTPVVPESQKSARKNVFGSSCWTNMKDKIEIAAQELEEDFSRLYQFAENAIGQNCVKKEPIVEEADFPGLHPLSDTHTECTKKKADKEENGKKIKRDSVAKSQLARKKISLSRCSSGMKEKIGKRTGVHLVETAKRILADSTTSCGDMPIPNVLQYTGITFYRRIGRWTAHIWAFDESKSKNGQCYIGSYSTASEAARAYDKAQLKHFDKPARLNFKKAEYLEDIEEMAKFNTNAEYRDYLKNVAKSFEYNTEEGVTRCFKGGFEVKIRERYVAGKPSGNWTFLGRFDNLADAERRYAMECKKLRNS